MLPGFPMTWTAPEELVSQLMSPLLTRAPDIGTSKGSTMLTEPLLNHMLTATSDGELTEMLAGEETNLRPSAEPAMV